MSYIKNKISRIDIYHDPRIVVNFIVDLEVPTDKWIDTLFITNLYM